MSNKLMTVAELKAHLDELPDDMPVVIFADSGMTWRITKIGIAKTEIWGYHLERGSSAIGQYIDGEQGDLEVAYVSDGNYIN